MNRDGHRLRKPGLEFTNEQLQTSPWTELPALKPCLNWAGSDHFWIELDATIVSNSKKNSKHVVTSNALTQLQGILSMLALLLGNTSILGAAPNEIWKQFEHVGP